MMSCPGMLLVISLTLQVSSSSSAKWINYTRDGDIILGGMVPFMYEPTCKEELGIYSIQIVETIVFSIDEVNQRQDLLPNITLGFDIRDDCNDEDMTLSLVLSLMGHYSTADTIYEIPSCNPEPQLTGQLLGIVGTSQSTTSMIAAKATNLYGIPMVSYSATSVELSDKNRFPFFLRTVPSDKFQAQAIVDILIRFQWVYVGVIYSLDTYGILGTQEIVALAEKTKICIAFSVSIQDNATPSNIKAVAKKISAFTKVRVLVMFGGFDGMSSALQEFHLDNPKERRTLICSDAFYISALDNDLANMIQGSLKIKLNYYKIPGIKSHFSQLTSQSQVSPWFLAYFESWLKINNCSDISLCPIPFSGTKMPIYWSVYAFAHAFDNMLRSRCPQMTKECLTIVRNITGKDVTPYLFNVMFNGSTGSFKFNQNGDSEGAYIIKTLTVDSTEIAWNEIGYWDTQNLDIPLSINESAITWPGSEPRPPISVCSDECPPGYIVIPTDEKCCWECNKCDPYEFVEGVICSPCPELLWPTTDFTSCETIPATMLNVKDAITIVLIALSVAGVLLACLSITGLIFYRKHPLIKATGRPLSLVAICGTVLAFLTTFAFLIYPSTASCSGCAVMIAMCFTMTYAPTLLKVNRIHRIFKAAKKSTRPPCMIRPKDQIITSAVFMMIQVVIVAVSAMTGDLSEPQRLMPDKLNKYVEIYCQFGNGFIASCVYNLLLILACCFYAFKTRKVPSNYNESKFIAVSVYSTLVLCLAAVPVYTTAVAVIQKVATLCMALILNAYLTLVCVYLPKLYAARFVNNIDVLKCSSMITRESFFKNRGLPGSTEAKSIPSVII